MHLTPEHLDSIDAHTIQMWKMFVEAEDKAKQKPKNGRS
jgi:hypothetical protein